MRAAVVILLALLVVAGCQSRQRSPFEIPVSKKKGKIGTWVLTLNDGTYRVMEPPRKKFLPKRVIFCAVFDPDEGVGFTVVYRDAKKIAFAKKIRIEKFIKNKEYRLVKDDKGRVDLLLPDDEPTGLVHVDFVPAKRQRVKEATLDLRELEYTSPAARGIRVAPKPVSKVKLTRADPPAAKKSAARKKAAAAAKKKEEAATAAVAAAAGKAAAASEAEAAKADAGDKDAK